MARHTLLLGASLLALTVPAAAQEVTTLSPIVVQGVDDPTAPANGIVATSQATATKTGTPRLETQQTDSVVTAEQIEATGATTLGQALGYSAGAFGEPFGLDARGDSPRLRGFDAGEAQFLNGLKLMRAFTAPSVETYGLERVEVLHGPSGVLYGSGVPGGLINLVQKRAQFDTFNEAGLTFGTNQRAGVYFDMNRMVSEDVAYRFTGLLRHQNGDAEEQSDDRLYLAPSVTWQIDGQSKLTFLASVQQDNPEQPTADLATAATGGPSLGPDHYAGDTGYNDSDRRQINLGMEWEHRFDDAWTLTQGFRYQKFDWDYDWLQVTPDGTSRYATREREDTETLSLDTRLAGRATTGAVDHQLLFGADIRRYDADLASTFQFGVPLTGDFTPAFGAASTTDTDVRQVGIYAQDEMSLGRWRANVALRHDWAKQEGTLFDGTTAARIDRSDSETTGRVGLSYVFDNGIAPFVSYATSFAPKILTPSSRGAADPSLGKQWEAGVKYQPLGFDGFFQASLFDLKQTDAPYDDFSTTPATIRSRDQDAQGIELEGTARFAEGWTVRGAYSYIDAEVTDGTNDGNTPENTPEHLASLWVGYDFDHGPLEGFGLGGGVRYLGERYADLGNTIALGDETLLDVSVSYGRGPLEGRLTVQNLTDETYIASCGYGCFWGAGRTVVADIAYTW